MGAIVSKLAFQPPPPGRHGDVMNEALKRQPGYAEVLTASGVTIPLVCCMPRGGRAAEKRHCLLFSHGNAEDLGETLPFLTRCAESLQLPVIGFEYPGYGLARSGRQGGGSNPCAPSEQGCFEAADAAYTYVREQYPEWRVVLFGRSLGSGPACFVAERLSSGRAHLEPNTARHSDEASSGAELAGLVLLSPLCSAIATQTGSLARLLRPIDLFVNSERISSIRCPVVVLHGTRDWVVPCSHGRALHGLAQDARDPLWLGGRGHNDIPEAAIFRHVGGFVARLP